MEWVNHPSGFKALLRPNVQVGSGFTGVCLFHYFNMYVTYNISR